MKTKKKVCYIISNIDKAIAFEWIVEGIDIQKFELSFVLLIPNKSCYLEEYLKEKEINVERILLESKKDYPSAILKCTKFLQKLKPDVVHCHLRDATIVGLIAAKLLSIPKRIYTRHHSTYHYEYFPKAVKWDKLANKLATHIIAISKNVENVLTEIEMVSPHKITLLHHGFKLDEFEKVEERHIQNLKQKYIPSNFNGNIIGVVSRFLELKGHTFIIEAAQKYLQQNPNALFVFANAKGADAPQIRCEIKNKIPTINYIEIEFENDLFALYKLFDFYIHVPINKEIEAFGQTYIEALASGVPSIFTLSGSLGKETNSPLTIEPFFK